MGSDTSVRVLADWRGYFLPEGKTASRYAAGVEGLLGGYLRHIADLIERVKAYTAGGEAAFRADPKTQDAVLHNQRPPPYPPAQPSRPARIDHSHGVQPRSAYREPKR